MNDMSESKQLCIEHYDKCVDRYVETYQSGFKGYPGNKARLKILKSIVEKRLPERILYIGCGAGIPVVELSKVSGAQVHGVDFSIKMVERARATLKEHGMDTALIIRGDLDYPETLPNGRFDMCIAAGVFTHLEDDRKAMANIHGILHNQGCSVLEYRNVLFSTYSFNQYSYDFYLNSLLNPDYFEHEELQTVKEFLRDKFNIKDCNDIPAHSTNYKNGFINKFHNPLTIMDELKESGFRWENNYFYHFHAVPPQFQGLPDSIKDKISLRFENPEDWRGNLLASAFISESVKM